MTTVTVKGCANAEKRVLVTSLVTWAGQQFWSRKRVHITVHFRSLHNRVDAICNNLDYMSYNPRNFVLEIDRSLTVMRALVAVAHEVVHVKQYVKGELFCNIVSDRMKFLGIEHDLLRPVNTLIEPDYFELPWEIEANGRQHGIVFQWMNAMGYDVSEKWFEKPF